MSVSGNSIKKLRKEAGLTQRKLAELAGITQAHVAKIEKGTVDPRLSTVNRILQVLTEGKKKKCKDIMTKGVFSAKQDDTILKISEIMVKYAISQIPVLDGKKIVGTITEESIIKNLGSNFTKLKAKDIMDSPLPTVSEEMKLETIRSILERRLGILIKRDKDIVGIITRSDLLKTIG